MWAEAQKRPVEIKLRMKNEQLKQGKEENKGEKEVRDKALQSDCC